MCVYDMEESVGNVCVYDMEESVGNVCVCVCDM